jgi:hypothetical protein
LERKMSFWALRSGESRKSSRLASRHPRRVSEGILEGPVLMVRPGPRKNMVGIPKIVLPWTKQRSGGTSRERLHREDHPCPRNQVPGGSEPGPSTRILTNQEREPLLTVRQCEGTHQGRTEEINQWWASNGSALASRRFPVSKSGVGDTSLGSGVPAKQRKSQ